MATSAFSWTMSNFSSLNFIKNGTLQRCFFANLEKFFQSSTLLETRFQHLFSSGFWKIFSLQLYQKQDTYAGVFLWVLRHFSDCNFSAMRLRHRCFTANFEKYFSPHFHGKLDLSTGFFWWILRHSSSCIFIKNKIQVQVFSCKFWEIF